MLLKHCKYPRNVALLAGDLNSVWNSSSPGGCHAGLFSWASADNWTNPLCSLSLQLSNPLFTHWVARHLQEGVEHSGVSWIDHILVHFHDQPEVVRGGTESHNDWITVSDHRPLWLDLHLPSEGTLPIPLVGSPPLPPPRRLPRENKAVVDRYRKSVTAKVRKLPLTLSPSDRLAQIAKISVDACPRPGDKPLSFYNSTKLRDGWSPLYIAHLTALSSIAEMRQHLTGASKRRLWRTPGEIQVGISDVTMRWQEQLQQLTWPTPEDEEAAATIGGGPVHWKHLARTDYGNLVPLLRNLEKDIKKKMHGRKRSEWRHNINAQSAAREDARKKGKTAAVIRSIFGTHTDRYDMNLLRLPDGSTLIDPVLIHEAHTKHWEMWHQGMGRKTFFDDHRIDWSHPHLSRASFLDYHGHSHIPPPILNRIWTAITQPLDQLPHLTALLLEATSSPVTVDELRAAIKRTPATSVPGPSGLSYAMMKEWSTRCSHQLTMH